MANEPVIGSVTITGVSPDVDANGNPVPKRIVVNDSMSPPALIVDLADRALRDLGKVDIAGYDVTNLYGVIDAASSGDNTLLAAQSGYKIRVVAVFLMAAGTVNVRFESGAGGTALTGQMNLVANTGFVLPYNPAGWFETAASTLLNLELSGAVSVDGCFTYVLA